MYLFVNFAKIGAIIAMVEWYVLNMLLLEDVHFIPNCQVRNQSALALRFIMQIHEPTRKILLPAWVDDRRL